MHDTQSRVEEVLILGCWWCPSIFFIGHCYSVFALYGRREDIKLKKRKIFLNLKVPFFIRVFEQNEFYQTFVEFFFSVDLLLWMERAIKSFINLSRCEKETRPTWIYPLLLKLSLLSLNLKKKFKGIKSIKPGTNPPIFFTRKNFAVNLFVRNWFLLLSKYAITTTFVMHTTVIACDIYLVAIFNEIISISCFYNLIFFSSFISLQLCDHAQQWANHLASTNEFYYRSQKNLGQNLFCCPISALVTDLTGKDIFYINHITHGTFDILRARESFWGDYWWEYFNHEISRLYVTGQN